MQNLSEKILHPLRSEAELFVPSAIYDIARNSNRVKTLFKREDAGELALTIFEESWYTTSELRRLKIREGFTASEQSAEQRLELHKKMAVKDGQMKPRDRILLMCRMEIVKTEVMALHVVNYDGLDGKGIGKGFFKNTLPAIARKLKINYITGNNNSANISFFEQKVGYIRYDKLTDEGKRLFFPDDLYHEYEKRYASVFFLNLVDKNRFVAML